MKVKATYQGNNEALVPARYGVGEHIVKTNFILADITEGEGKEQKVIAKKNEPVVNSEIEIDVDANGRDEITNDQESAYQKSQSVQNEVPPPQPFFGETPKPRKPKPLFK